MSRLPRVSCAVLTALVVLGVALACKRRASPPAPLIAPSAAACDAWGRRVERSLAVGDASFMLHSIDYDQLGKRVLVGVTLPKGDRQRQERAFLAGLRSEMRALPEELVRQNAAGASYRYLRVKHRRGQAVVLFRMLDERGRVNYHEWLMTVVGGTARAVDMYGYVGGQYVSDMMRPLIAQGFGSGLPDGSLRGIQRVTSHYQRQQWDQTLQAIRRLPPEVQQTKMIMLMRIGAAQNVSDAAYRQALEDYAASFGEDASAALVTLDHSFLQQRYDECLKKLDILERDLGADGHLYCLRANVWLEKGDLRQARDSALRAAQAEPELKEAWWAQLRVSLRASDDAETARLLAHMEQGLGIEIGDISKIAGYQGFVQSPEYRQWQASRRSPGQ